MQEVSIMVRDGPIHFQNTRPTGEDRSSETAKYKIITYGADFTIEVLYNKLVNEEIVIPPFSEKVHLVCMHALWYQLALP